MSLAPAARTFLRVPRPRQWRRIPWFVPHVLGAYFLPLVMLTLIGRYIVRVFKGSTELFGAHRGGFAHGYKWTDVAYYNPLNMWIRHDSDVYALIAGGNFFAPLTPYDRDILNARVPPEVWSENLHRFVFAPLYPLLAKLLLPFTLGHVMPAMTIVTWVSGLAALCYVGLLARHFYGVRAGVNAIWLLALAPTGFFLHSLLTEPLFVGLMLATFYHARKQQWVAAGVLGFLLGLSRSNGFLISACLLLILLAQRRWRFDGASLRYYAARLLAAAAPGLGWGAFMVYCAAMTGRPMAYLDLQRHFTLHMHMPWTNLHLGWLKQGPAGGLEAAPMLVVFLLAMLALMLVCFWKVPLPEALTTPLLLWLPLTVSHMYYGILRYIWPLFAFVLFFAWLTSRKRLRQWFPAVVAMSAMAQSMWFILWTLDWTLTIV